MKNRLGLTFASAVVLVFVAAVLLSYFTGSTFESPWRVGPPALIMHAEEPYLWMMLKQEEQRQTGIAGSSRRSSNSTRPETRHHFDIQCHDTRTTKPLWKKRLLTLKGNEGSSAKAQILGQQGGAVWIFLNDQPLALSAVDSSVLAGRETIEQRNPALRGILPAQMDFYTFDDGLIVTAADAKQYRLTLPDYAAEAYTPEKKKNLVRPHVIIPWSGGGYPNSEFVVRHTRIGEEWLGLFTPKEAAAAREDRFGRNYAEPSRIIRESKHPRRSFWKAQVGLTEEFPEDRHPRIVNLTQVPGTSEFLEGGLLVEQGTKNAVVLRDPEGVLVLHLTRIDAEGRLALTRVNGNFQETWRTVYPFSKLHFRWEFPDRLLLTGTAEQTTNGRTSRYEYLASTTLADGRTVSWNVTQEGEAE